MGKWDAEEQATPNPRVRIRAARATLADRKVLCIGCNSSDPTQIWGRKENTAGTRALESSEFQPVFHMNPSAPA